MGNANNICECIVQNLKDAGLDKEAQESCLALYQQERSAELLEVLSSKRRTLLAEYNECQDRLDALDYLIYSLRKKQPH